MYNHGAGKGDKSRPLSVEPKTFQSNWDRIFNKETKSGNTEKENNYGNKTNKRKLTRRTENP